VEAFGATQWSGFKDFCQFYSPTRVIAGRGLLEGAGFEFLKEGARRTLVVTDQVIRGTGLADRVVEGLSGGGVEVAGVFDQVPQDSDAASVAACAATAKEEGADSFLALGGGSVIDTAKAVSVLATQPGPVTRYFRGANPLPKTVAPLIAVPTTAGTGSEVSRGAGIHPDGASRGSGLSGPEIVPRVAICDPELTFTLPPRLTAGTGMDALVHAAEGFLATSDNAPVAAIAADAIRRVFAFLPRAVADGADREARREIMMAALEGGIAISRGLGPAHAIGNTFGDRGLHHGAMVSIALPPTLRFHARHNASRLVEMATAIGYSSGAEATEAIAELHLRVGLPPTLRGLGYPDCDLDEAAEDAHRSFFNAGLARPPTRDEYVELVREAMG